MEERLEILRPMRAVEPIEEPQAALGWVYRAPPRPAEAAFVVRGTQRFHWELVDDEGRLLGISAETWPERRRVWLEVQATRLRSSIRSGFQVHTAALACGQEEPGGSYQALPAVLRLVRSCPEVAPKGAVEAFVQAAAAVVLDETRNGSFEPSSSV